ncbi:MAG: GxxExxY protein [Bacteroidota bacterium]|nr:GxxExxY protein [Bacteroidota bacterium]
MKELEQETELLVHKVIGAAIEVHKVLGPGYLESIYESALCIELEKRNIAFVRQHKIAVSYKGKEIGEGRLDLFVENKVVVELKTVEALLPIHKAQVISYLKTTGCQIALLINFNTVVLTQGLQRIILTK